MISYLDALGAPRVLDARSQVTTIYSYHPIASEPGRSQMLYSGLGPATTGLITRYIERDGHAIIENTGRNRTWNHRAGGIGITHDDARFAESGCSMAAWHESPAAWQGPWWQAPGGGLRHFGLRPDGTRQ